METVNLPLSGPVMQTFFPWTMNLTVNVGMSSNAAIEKEALSVASYGKQIGRISEVLLVLIKHMPRDIALSPDEEQAITDLKSMLNEIANVKKKHGAPMVITPS